MTPPPTLQVATNMAQLNEPYERFPTNELRRECYRRKLTIIKSGPLANATKVGFLKLLRESDLPTKGNGNDSGSTSPHTTLAAFQTVLDAGCVPVADKLNAPSSSALPQLIVSSPPRHAIVSPPPSPTATAPPLPPRPPRMDLVKENRALEANEKRGHPTMYGESASEASQAKKLKTVEPHPIPDSQSTTPSQTPTESTSVFSSLLSEPEMPARVKVKTEGLTGATVSIVTRWERLFARLEAVNEKLQALRAPQDPWATSIGSEDASDVEFYTIMKRQLQKELLDCVSST